MFLGYAWEFFPRDVRVDFPYNTRDMNIMWYVSYLSKDIRSVILVWALWAYGIPKKDKLLKLGVSIFCIMLTMVPIFFVLFHSAPFHYGWFAVKVVISIIIGFIITYFDGRIWTRNNTHSGNS